MLSTCRGLQIKHGTKSLKSTYESTWKYWKVYTSLQNHRHLPICKRSYLGFFLFFGWTGVWTQGFVLAKQVLYSLSYASSPFCSGCFEDGILRTICLGWPQTLILPMSASQIVKITGMSHKHPPKKLYLSIYLSIIYLYKQDVSYLISTSEFYFVGNGSKHQFHTQPTTCKLKLKGTNFSQCTYK
jgi:hypothetical protein